MSDLIRRAVPSVAALVALLAGAPQPVAGGLALAGLALATERLVRLRGTGPADRVLVGLGGVLVALVLTGISLGSTALGLSPTTWVVAVAVLGVAGLVTARVLPTRSTASPADATPVHGARGTGRGRALRLLPWVALAAVLVVALVRTSGASLSAADQPPLQMSFGRVAGTRVQVVVTSSNPAGPLEVRTSTGGDDISYPLFDVPTDGSVTTTLSLPRTGRFVVTLNRPDQTTPLRTLILDR
jgi:hypothetical protein